MFEKYVPRAEAAVLVVGDVILDRYLHGSTTRISPEAPVPVVRVDRTEERPGGAANVALNIRSLGVRVQLAGITGSDPAAGTLRQILDGADVVCGFVEDPDFPTVTKVRVVSQHQQLLRLDYEAARVPDTRALYRRFLDGLPDVDCVVLSDYAKGSLDHVGEFIDAARARAVPVLVDPKARDFERYRHATLLTPNAREFEAIVGACPDADAIAAKGLALCRGLGLEALLVTRGEHGMTLLNAGSGEIRHLPAHAREVYDVTGAGDTVIAALAAAVASGYPLEAAAGFANVAAGLVVGRLGTATVSADEINGAIIRNLVPGAGQVLEPEEVARVVAAARQRGERIVMTNGCFDLLHAGHVQYLAQARGLGDRLLVAVNDDRSVRRLKGPGRPLNGLVDRMRLIAALGAVDWVTAFGEDTPERLIACVRPDVLVKGGDYAPEQIAGANTVRAYGGSVVTLPFVEGYSTTGAIDAIRAG